jgi:hypothetical protein
MGEPPTSDNGQEQTQSMTSFLITAATGARPYIFGL